MILRYINFRYLSIYLSISIVTLILSGIRTAFTDLNLYCIKGALALFVLVSFFWLRVLDKAEYSSFESTLNSSVVSYRIVS